MPDQSTAATEHAIIQEITAPLGTLPDDPLSLVSADFPLAMRGYDRPAVDAYVQQTRQLLAELQATRSPEAAVRRALERVGEQIAGILQRAHDTAEEITAQSRREAEDRLEQARVEAAEIVAGAQRRVTDLDNETDRIWAERHRIIDDARELAQQLIALAEPAADRFPAADNTPYDDETTTRAPIVIPRKPVGNEEPAVDDEGYVDDESAPAHDESVYVRYEDEHERLGGDPAGDHYDTAPPIEAEAPAEPEDPDDLEETVAFRPLDSRELSQEPEDLADPPEPPPPPRPPDPVIPPASQAANRRTSN